MKYFNILIVCLLFSLTGLAQRITVAPGGGGGGGGSTDTTSLSNRINGKVSSVGPQRSVVHADNSNYAQSPIAFQTTDGWIFVCTNESPEHTGTGVIKLRESKDGSNWSEPWTVTVSGFDTLGVPQFGSYGNRLIMSFQRVPSGSPDYLKLFSAYSEDRGRTWTLSDSTGLYQSQQKIFGYGKIAPVVGDTLYRSGYSNWDVDTSSAYIDVSYNGGLTWRFSHYVKRGRFGVVFPNGGFVTEMDWQVVTQGANILNTEIAYTVRPEIYFGYHYFLYKPAGTSTIYDVAINDGKWLTEFNTPTTDGTSDVGTNQYPINLFKHGNYLYAIYGHRGVNGVSNGDHQVRVMKVSALNNAWKNPDNWSKPRSFHNDLSGTTSFPNDFGYGTGFLANNQLYALFYGISTKHSAGASSNVKTRIWSLPLEGNNYFEAHDRSNQSITTGTETRVLTRRVKLDTEGAYNRDSTKIYFPEDGWYTITARVTFDASASGTFRRVRVMAVNPGDEFGIAPSTIAGKYIIAQRSIAPSTNAEFNRVELSGQFYAIKGMELRLTVQHDVGSSLNILNTDINNRATIQFKKSD